MTEYAWLIPLIPVLAFGLIIAFGRRLPGEGAYVAIGAMLSSLVMSVVLAVQWFAHATHAHGHEIEPFSSRPLPTPSCEKSLLSMSPMASRIEVCGRTISSPDPAEGSVPMVTSKGF